MRQLDLDLLRTVTSARAPDTPPPPGRGARFHSDAVRPGDVFFALHGERTHGIAFADDALARGAAFVVSDRPHPRGIVVPDPAQTLLDLGRAARAQLRGPVVGVTGSAGKTSTKALLREALAARATPGNLNTPLALACTLLDAALGDDPERPLVLELGIDHVGEMDRLVHLTAPDHAVLTVVAPSHLDGLGSVAGVAREKSVLLGAAPGVRLASWQAWQQLDAAAREGVTAYRVLDPHETDEQGAADDVVVARREGAGPASQRLRYGATELLLPWPGAAMAHNALAALAMAERLGVPLDAAAARISAARLDPGRLEFRRVGDLLVLDDSYNSNPASAAAALDVLRGCPPPRAAVLGDMLELGEDSAAYHRALGAATRDLDVVLAVGREAEAFRQGNPRARTASDPEAARAHLPHLPLRGTVLFKASRGVRLERLLDAFLARLEATSSTSAEAAR